MMKETFKYRISRPLFCNGQSCWSLIGVNGKSNWRLMTARELETIMSEKSDNWAFTEQIPPSLQIKTC